MAGDWIKFEVSTSDKPEVWAMADELGIDADAVVGKLLRVWAWFDQQTPDGNATSVTSSVTSSVTKSLLDRRVGVSGFCDAMISVGWMLESGGIVSLPNFNRHNGKTAKTRALTAKRVANHKTKSNATSVTSSVSDALPREEKRREENNTHTHAAPDWLEKDWKRWCNYREARDGRPMDAILSETVLMDLMRRGDGKAQRDIEFSILKQARSILDSDNDFSKRTGHASSGTGSRRYGKPTAEEIYKQREAENPPTPEDIEARERILKLQKEMWDESIRR
jgi:hypothetical protein